MRLALFAFVLPLAAQIGAFRDGLEGTSNWILFEEQVAGSACYGTGIGTVGPSAEEAWSGGRSLQLWANQKQTRKSNHLIAVNRLGNRGRQGRWTYSAWAYVAPSVLPYQTGPEISIQNTRRTGPGQFVTHTAAVQYLANENRKQGWSVWKRNAKGDAAWEPLFDYDIARGKWYRLALEVDYDRNRYGWFTIEGPDGAHTVDLSATELAPQKKHDEEAFAITLEAENHWNNCGETGAFDARVYYDDISLVPTVGPSAGAVHPAAGQGHRQRFRFEFPSGTPDRAVQVANILINRELNPSNACYLAYSVNAGLLHVMDNTGTKTVDAMPVPSESPASGDSCQVHSASARRDGDRLLLDLDLSFVAGMKGNQTIFLAARDGRDGNSGWVAAGRWLLKVP